MKLDFIKNNEKQFSVAMFAISALLAAGVVIGLLGFIVTTVKASQLASTTVKKSGADANDMNSPEGQEETLVEKLKKKNAFVPPPPEEKFPVDSVSGIFGREVLINGKWYKAGDKIGEGEIVSIEPTEVTVKWKDTEKKFAPIAAMGSAKKSVAKQPDKEEEAEDEEKKAQAKATGQAQTEQVSDDSEDPLAWLGVELTESQREKIEYFMNNMPPQIVEAMKMQWNMMSDEEKQNAIQELDNVSMREIEEQVDQMNQMNLEDFQP